MKFFNKFGIKSRNINLMYGSTVIGGMLFFLPILALYFEKNLFSITNVALIFSIEAIAVMVFEIPTGAIADLFGRKKIIISSKIVYLLAIILLYIGGSMFIFVLYAILAAFAYGLSSGTGSAIIYDTLKEEKKEQYYKKIKGNVSALWPLGASIGAIIGGYLANISLALPILLTLIPVSLDLLFSLFLKEPVYEKKIHKNILKHMQESSKTIIGNRQLIILFLGSFFLMGLGEAVHLLGPIFFKFKELPIIYFGYITTVVFGFSSLGHYFSHSISERFGDKRTLVISAVLSPLLLILATITFKFTSVLIFAIPSVFFGIRNPIRNHLLNKEVDSANRATVLSTSSFVEHFSEAIFIPLVGYLAKLYTINTAFKLSAVLMFIVPLVYLFLKKK